jgi:hypothetical protein
MKEAVTEKSPMMAAVEKEESAKSERKPARAETTEAAPAPAAEAPAAAPAEGEE